MQANAFDDDDEAVSGRRVAAISGAMTVHLIAAGFFLLPLTVATVVREAPPDDMVWIVPEVVPAALPLPPVPDPPAIPRVRHTPAPPVPTPVEPEVVEPTTVDTPAIAEYVPTPALPTAEPDGGDVATPLGGTWGLTMTKATPPPYPRIALKKGWYGTVMLRILVDVNGMPLEIELLRSSGRAVLDQAAIKAAYEWRFKPAMDRGIPVQAWGQVPVEFHLPSRG